MLLHYLLVLILLYICYCYVVLNWFILVFRLYYSFLRRIYIGIYMYTCTRIVKSFLICKRNKFYFKLFLPLLCHVRKG